MMSADDWASDVPISMPEPLDTPGLLPMAGFTFTEWGLRFDLNEADHEALRTPTFAPPDPEQEFHDGR